MSSLILIRAKLTAEEWKQVRRIGIDRDVPVSQLVADAIRDALLKGAKP
jgi:hypothetical protein